MSRPKHGTRRPGPGESQSGIEAARPRRPRAPKPEASRSDATAWRAVVESMGHAVLLVSPEGRVEWMNPAAEALTGWSVAEAAGQTPSLLLGLAQEAAPGAAPEAILGVSEPSCHAPIGLRRRDGTERWVSAAAWTRGGGSGKAGEGWTVVLRDVTEAHHRETDARQTERLAAWGKLAAGIAHDFNNVLMVILGNISMAKLLAGASAELKERLDQAGQGCLRARELMQRLQVLAPGVGLRKRHVALGDVVRPALESALRGSGVRAEIVLPPSLWPVDVDVAQLNQAFQHLATNAAQAMPGGGALRVRAENTVPGAWSDVPLQAHGYVRCVVSDTGPGIAPDDLPRVLDPFFTTKRGAHGLGLTAVLAIVKRHGGLLRIHSPPGDGTIAELFLPAAGEWPGGIDPAGLRRSRTSGARILVMDDQPLVGEMARGLLRNLGCEVTVARDGEQALALYRAALDARQPFAAVILDLMVPGGMGGQETMRRLVQLDPSVRAIVSSGYSSDPAMIEPARHGFRAAVAKPYAVEELARVVESVLEPEDDAPRGGQAPPSGKRSEGE